MTDRTYGTITYETADTPAWIVACEPHVMMRLKRIFPRVSLYARGHLALKDTPEVAADLAWCLDRWPMLMDDIVRARLLNREREYVESRDAVISILDGHASPLGIEPAIAPREYQVPPAEIVRATGRLLLADELGLGKTFSSLLVLLDPETLPALVVTLTHLPKQWERELSKFLPWLSAHILKTTTPHDIGSPDVVITNYHKLAGWQHHLAGKVQTVIFDEAQELRLPGSQKYDAASYITRAAKFAMGLTATPVYNYGDEIHSIISVLDEEVLGTREEFVREWCSYQSNTKAKVREPAALGAYLRDEGLMLRRTRRDVGRELPEVQRIMHQVDCDTDVLEHESAGAAELAELILNTNAAPSERWQASGELDWRLRHATGVAKAKYVSAFTRMLLETGEPVVLFGWHRDVYEFWAGDLFSARPAFYTGSESPAQKERARTDFLSGETNLLIMSLRSGAGLDGLQERAHVAVFGELDWSPGVHEQCIGRLHRDGQDDPVVAYFLVADEGSDPAIAEVLNLKQMQSRPIVDPDAAPIQEAELAHDRVKVLAQEYLRRKRGLTVVAS